jgi:hypothetical protein
MMGLEVSRIFHLHTVKQRLERSTLSDPEGRGIEGQEGRQGFGRGGKKD